MTTSLHLMEVPGWRAPKYGSSFIARSALSLTLRLLSWTQYSTTAGPPKSLSPKTERDLLYNKVEQLIC